MWKKHYSGGYRGWVLPDALLALSIISMTVISAQDFLQTTHQLEQQRQVRLERIRQQHDRALAEWLTVQ